MSRCWLFAGVLLALYLVGLAGEVSARSSDDGIVRISGQQLPTPADSGISQVAMREVMRVFLERHPNIEIEPFTMPSVGGTNLMDTGTLMAISAGVPPHLMYVNFRQSSTYIKQGFLEPLEILFARIESDNPRVREADAAGNWLEDPTPEEIEVVLERMRSRVLERVWPVIYRPESLGREGQHHVWALPVSNLVAALFYRRDLFVDAGLDPDRPPRDWDELLEFARRLTVPENDQYGMMFVPGQNISWSAYFLLVSNGVRAMEMDEEGNWVATFNGENAAEALLFLWRMLREPFERDGRMIQAAAMISGQARVHWSRGKVGMTVTSLDEEMLATVNPQLVGIAPVPVAPRGEGGGEINARMYGVFAGASPEQKLAAARFIDFLTSEEAQRIRTRVFVESGYGQFVNPDLLRRFGYESYLRRVPVTWREAFDVAVRYGVPEPYGDNTQNIYRFMSRPINQTLETDIASMDREEAIATIMGFLDQAVAEVNQDVLGQISVEEQRFRNRVAWAVLIALALIFAYGMLHIWKYFTEVGGPSQSITKQWRKYLWGYLLVIPGVALVLMWSYLPLAIGGFSIAFMDYRVVQESIWVGVENFANVLFDDRFWSSLWRTFYFVALTIGLGFWPPILLAILLQEVPTNFLKYFYRTVFYLPSVLIGVVVMFLWMQLYNPTESGILNQILMSLNELNWFSATLIRWIFIFLWGSFLFTLIWLPIRLEEMTKPLKVSLWIVGIALAYITLAPFVLPFLKLDFGTAMAGVGSLFGGFDIQPLRWTESPELAMLCIIIPGVWASTGPGCIIYLAALKSVPDELYEAAEIDGAGHWHKVFYIILPRLKYLIIIQFVAAVIGAFKGGEEMILVMTGGGPNDATTILSLEIFFRTFVELNFGLGTAMAWIIGALLIAFTAYQLKLLSRAEFRAAG